MKFKLDTAGYDYRPEEAKRLGALGFKFRPPLAPIERHYCPVENLLKLERQDIYIEIKTLEDLMRFINEWGEVVVTDDSIQIQNDYRE